MRSIFLFKIGVIGLLTSLSSLGCGGAENVPQVTPSLTQLRTIAMTYAKATEDLDHPPRTKEELLPYFKSAPDPEDPDLPVPEIDVAKLFRSPTDGEDYVIIWGVDYREYQGARRDMPVFAYEKVGKDGKRLVAQGRFVHTVTDEQLAELPFPTGYKPP